MRSAEFLKKRLKALQAVGRVLYAAVDNDGLVEYKVYLLKELAGMSDEVYEVGLALITGGTAKHMYDTAKYRVFFVWKWYAVQLELPLKQPTSLSSGK